MVINALNVGALMCTVRGDMASIELSRYLVSTLLFVKNASVAIAFIAEIEIL